MSREENLIIERDDSSQSSANDNVPNISSTSNSLLCGIEECKRLIPAFNPSSNSVSAYDWISNVERVRNIFKWDNNTTIFYAALRLEEAASSWFSTIKEKDLTWEEFKKLLMEAFPTVKDESDMYLKIMCRVKQPNESVEKYFYDVLALARRAGFSDECAKNYIVSGLKDKELINAVTGYLPQCSTLQELLCQIKAHLCILDQQRNREIFLHNNLIPSLRSEQNAARYRVQNFRPNITCFNCQELGHFSRDCKKPRKRSERPPQNYSAAKIARVAFNRSSGLTQDALSDGQYVKVFCDLGSECSTIKIFLVEKFGWKFEKGNVKLIGFGGNEVNFSRIIKI